MSTTLVISDTHLCDPFEPKKLAFLQKLFSQCDRVILNGDFWEGYWYTFDEFLNSKWSALFHVLKQKHTIYIYGNHDRENYSDSRREQFCVRAAWRHEETIGGIRYVFEHGNRLALKFDEKVHMQRVSRILFIPLYLTEMFIVRILGLKFFHFMFGKLNRKIKRLIKYELKACEIFVSGHTHVREYAPGSQFINTGVNKYGFSEYGIIDESGVMTLHTKRYD